jgi:hypothetical protein
MRCWQVPDLLAEWGKIYKRAREKNGRRNELAHGMVMRFGKPYNEVYFVPAFFKNMLADVPKMFADFPHISLDPRPKNRLTAQQIAQSAKAFQLFRIRLDRFDERLCELV